MKTGFLILATTLLAAPAWAADDAATLKLALSLIHI